MNINAIITKKAAPPVLANAKEGINKENMDIANNLLLFMMIKKFSSPKIEIWFEPMSFSGFFCGFERCGSLLRQDFGGQAAAFPNSRGGISSPRHGGTKCVRTNSRILHHVGNCKFEGFASRSLSALSADSATNLYSILGVKTNSRFRILGEEIFIKWCPGWGSNPHALRHTILSRARVPVSPPGLPVSGLKYLVSRVRHGRDSDPRIAVLQTAALPLRHRAVYMPSFVRRGELRRGDVKQQNSPPQIP